MMGAGLSRKKQLTSTFRRAKDHLDRTILYSGSKAQDKGNSRNHGFGNDFYRVFWAPNLDYLIIWCL